MTERAFLIWAFIAPPAIAVLVIAMRWLES